MRLLSRAVVQHSLTMPEAIASIEALLALQSTQPERVQNPERTVLATLAHDDSQRTGSHLTMPAVIEYEDISYAVVKLVNICPDNPSRGLPTTVAMVTVSDNRTGEVLAVMDGTYLTQVRTGALSAIATKHLATAHAKTVAVLGCGGMAYEQLHAVLTVRPSIETVQLWNRSTGTTQAFAQRFCSEYPQYQGLNFVTATGIGEAVANADVINLATRAEAGLFERSQILPHAHINAVGAYLPQMKEVSDTVIAGCRAVVVDDVAGCHHEAGDLLQADANPACAWQWRDLIGDLAQLALGELVAVTGVPTDTASAPSLFKSVGASRFDAVVAIALAKKAVEQGLGEVVGV